MHCRISCCVFQIFVHKDYDDEGAIFVYKYIDFTADKEKIRNFIRGTGPSGGGDAECYELALHKVRTEFAWRKGLSTLTLISLRGNAIDHKCPPLVFPKLKNQGLSSGSMELSECF